MALQRSLSETSVKMVYIDNELKSLFQNGLSQCWKDSFLFDVELVPGDKDHHVVKNAHKLVLACVSPYFRALFSPQHNGESKTRAELSFISSKTLDLVLQFVYTAKVELTGENVQDLTMAANFLQLQSLENACIGFISENINESNFIEVFNFAVNAGLTSLQNACESFKIKNLGSIMQSSTWLELSVSDVEDFLRNDRIHVYDSSKIIPPASIQEKLLFSAVLRYIQATGTDDSKHPVLIQLLKHIRFELMSMKEVEEVKNTLKHCNNQKLTSACNAILDKSMKKTEDAEARRQRNYLVLKNFTSFTLAHGYVNNIVKEFHDQAEGRYLKGMKIWIRRWDGRPVFGAIEVTYNDGRKLLHGQKSNYEVYEFMTDPDEFIIHITASSGWMVDQLTFVTNKNRKFGPYGGDGGGKREIHMPVRHGYLSYISGSEASTQGSLGIVSLSFHWQIYDFEDIVHSRDYNLQSYESNSEDSEDMYSS